MTLFELVQQYPFQPGDGVPDTITGCFRRHAISFANGETDTETRVFWLQSRNLTIDLRLPAEHQPLSVKPLGELESAELALRANCEGWIADCRLSDGLMDWDNFTSLQLHNRWQEPAQLRRIGNCMIEFAPSGAYAEDWRLQPSAPGPLIGLRLQSETDSAGRVVRSGGGLIVCGDYAALVLERRQPQTGVEPARTLTSTIASTHASTNPLRELAARHLGNGENLSELLDFETSVARRSPDGDYRVIHSTLPQRVGEILMDFDGFDYLPGSHQLCQRFAGDNGEYQRIFAIDTLEPQQHFSLATAATQESADWFEREAVTLQRYSRVLN